MIDIAKEISKIRKNLGLTQIEFSDKVGIGQPYISKIEAGKIIPPIETLIDIANKTGFEVNINLKEKEVSKQQLFLKFENKEFVLGYQSYTQNYNSRKKKQHSFKLILNLNFYNLLEFLEKIYPKQISAKNLNNIDEATLQIPIKEDTFSYTLNIKGEINTTIRFKPLELSDYGKNYLIEKLQEKTIMNTTEQDQDLLLANQFSEAIDNLIEEILPLIDAKNLYYIINLKLKRVFEEYKDTVLYGCSYDELRENIISKIRVIKREEDKKKEYSVLTEFNKALENIKRDSVTYSMSDLLDKLNTLCCLYGSVLNLSLDDVKKKYFELNSK